MRLCLGFSLQYPKTLLPLIVPRVPFVLYPRFGTASAEGFSPPRAKRFNRYRFFWKPATYHHPGRTGSLTAESGSPSDCVQTLESQDASACQASF
ncbi:hypothetical protein THTE_0434 [Thermogutta terrifontis]|uniref:Uncharacterized protein n=1 Tax=Thermogutta terrifontis TaxID=1331910 RepID=A0A286RAP7_9BACT|nr:hypothetical protein THTE_0434 [Thermogutta terrifontis]